MPMALDGGEVRIQSNQLYANTTFNMMHTNDQQLQCMEGSC